MKTLITLFLTIIAFAHFERSNANNIDSLKIELNLLALTKGALVILKTLSKQSFISKKHLLL